MTQAVANWPDQARILSLPRRVWGERETAEIVERMTALFRTRAGTQTLLPHQAIALAEALAYPDGLFVPLPVGAGKTLISFLLMRAFSMKLGLVRPLLVTRASLVEKTHDEALAYRRDWVLPTLYRVESYEKLARVQAADFWRDYAPDLVILDESQAVKNRGASVTRRVFRYLHANEAVPLVAMTGSPIGTSIRDCAHVIGRCLRARSPLPLHPQAVLEWSRALDVEVPPLQRLEPGALEALCAPGEPVNVAIGRRVIETPGVITMRGTTIDTPIEIRSLVAPHDAAQTEAMRNLRELGARPDGELAEDSIAIWRHAREIALGFFSFWDPKPPAEWIDARRAWHAICRDTLEHNRRDLDSAEQLARHVVAHPDHYPDVLEAYVRWKRAEPLYRIQTRETWISASTVQWIAQWLDREGGAARARSLIWTDRPAFGAMLSTVLGIPYHGENGLDARGVRLDTLKTGPAIASSGACGTGLNLQHAFSRNLCTDIPKQPIRWEQRIGRTHRIGQKAPKVEIDLLFGVIEDARAFALACEHAANAQALTAQPQKLCSADTTGVAAPEDFSHEREPRWTKAQSEGSAFRSRA